MEKLVQNGLPTIKKQHAKLLIGITVALVMIAAIIFIASRTISSSNDISPTGQNPQSAANISIVEGAPRVEKFGRISRTVNENEEISKGDVITTDGISRAIIVFSNNSTILIDTNSRVEIKNIQTGDSPEISLYQMKGSIFVRGEGSVEPGLKVLILTDFSSLELGESRANTILTDETYYIENRKGMISLKILNESETLGEYNLDENATLEINTAEIENYSNEYIEENVSFTASPEETFWYKLIDCVDYKISDILSQGNFEKKNYLKNKINQLTVCPTEIREEEFDKLNDDKLSEAEAAAAKQELEKKKNPPQITAIEDSGSISNDLTQIDKISCTWSATGESIKGYEYSVGTSQGATDMKSWTATTNLSVTVSDVGMVYGEKYYCNVKAISDYGTSQVKSSNGVAFDDSNITGVSVNTSFPGTITGDVEWDEFYDLDDYIVKIYVKNSANKYSNGTEWLDSLTWHETDITTGTDMIDWETTTEFTQDSTEYNGATIYIQVENTLTGKIYQTTKTI